MEENIKLSPPWITFYRELNELFKNDEQVKIFYDENAQTINIEVTDREKAQAIATILPAEKEFGNVKIEIEVTYKELPKTIEDIYKLAFNNNPILKYAYTFQTDTNPITYIVFEKKVVQYWNDDMSDPHGVTSTLYENIARNIFKNGQGVIYSTDCDQKPEAKQKRYFKNHATPEEIEQWEYYNGHGSYVSNSGPRNDQKEPTKVNNKETFKNLFDYTCENCPKQEACDMTEEDLFN